MRVRYNEYIDSTVNGSTGNILPGVIELEVINTGTVDAVITQHVPVLGDVDVTIKAGQNQVWAFISDVSFPLMTYNDGGTHGALQILCSRFYNV